MGSANANRALRLAEESHRGLVTAEEHAELFDRLAKSQFPGDSPVAQMYGEVAEAYREWAKRKRKAPCP